MKKMILVGAVALLGACGGSKNNQSDSSTADTNGAEGAATESIEGSDDTITVSDFSDMPPKCIELLGDFLKKIEPTVSNIDWEASTVADFEAFSAQFEADSAEFDAQTAAEGCDNYNLEATDEEQFEQMTALAAAEAPGTIGFLNFIKSLTGGATDAGEPVPTDCAGTIAATEPFLAKGTMQELTMAEVTRMGQLMTGISTNCTEPESTAFFARDDVVAFIGS